MGQNCASCDSARLRKTHAEAKARGIQSEHGCYDPKCLRVFGDTYPDDDYGDMWQDMEGSPEWNEQS